MEGIALALGLWTACHQSQGEVCVSPVFTCPCAAHLNCCVNFFQIELADLFVVIGKASQYAHSFYFLSCL